MKNRYRILGQLQTKSPMHIGCGDIVTYPHKALADKDDNPNEIQGIVRDHRGMPCIPGTSLKGSLRSWAEQALPNEGRRLDRIFGAKLSSLSEQQRTTAESGWCEFLNCFVGSIDPELKQRIDEFVPFGQGDRLTGIVSHVCIDRNLGTAAHNKVFFQEFVPAGTVFDVEVCVPRLSYEDAEFLLLMLKAAPSYEMPLQLGANTANGWGLVTWSSAPKLFAFDRDAPKSGEIGFAQCVRELEIGQDAEAAEELVFETPECIKVGLQLLGAGPFLVNDASRTKHNLEDAPETACNFMPLKHADGTVWLPASSLRGVLRSRCEYILNSLNPKATGDPNKEAGEGPVERLFGSTQNQTRLRIYGPKLIDSSVSSVQELVGIDRFTGGAADGAKYNAQPAWNSAFDVEMQILTEGLKDSDIALFHRALKDLCRGDLGIGWGVSRGYGNFEGMLDAPELEKPQYSDLRDLFDATALETKPIARVREMLPAEPAASVLFGTLSSTATKKGFHVVLSFEDAKGKSKTVPITSTASLHPSFRNVPFDSVQVDFERNETGQNVRIRPTGEPWQSDEQTQSSDTGPGDFANPYNFVRMVDRSSANFQNSELGDYPGVPHERVCYGHYSGDLEISLTVATPLLLCDDANREPSEVPDHWIYPLRTDESGQPVLHASGVRGVLRSAFEIITNSRFGIFPAKCSSDLERSDHSRRLGYRMHADDGLSLVPVRIEGNKAHLMLGTNPHFPVKAANGRWKVPGGLLHAAWVPQYRKNAPGLSPQAIQINGRPPMNGEEAWCWLEKIRHRDIPFSFWRVRQAATSEVELPSAPPSESPLTERYEPKGEWKSAKGYFVVSNQNNQEKHDERFFFVDGEATVCQLPDSLLNEYKELLYDCRRQHLDDVERRNRDGIALDAYRVDKKGVGIPALSRHNYDDGVFSETGPSFCYAKVEGRPNALCIKSLHPVTISRVLYEEPPLECLPELLRPAESRDELSPADRVFGWVSQASETASGESAAAYRGNILVRSPRCKSPVDEAVEEFPRKTLAILAQPKPQQGRFYLGDKAGFSQGRGKSKEASGYEKENRIRGPKVYLHHAQATDMKYVGHEEWQRQNQEAFSDEPSNQNRSITGWVKPGAEFCCKISVANLSRIELGALFWLLRLPEDHYFRMGLGKPLGFGSVSFSLEKQTVAIGEKWIDAFKDVETIPEGLSEEEIQSLSDEFEQLMQELNPTLLESFRIAAKGIGDTPIYYPRTAGQATEGEHFKWFMKNESKGQRHTLPDLVDDVSLPLL